MSNKDNAYKGSTFWQLILVIPGTILAFTLLIALIAKTSGVTSTSEVAKPSAVDAQVEANIKPVAEVQVASAEAGPHVDKSGAEVVTAVCGMCHSAGLMNAPKIGDNAQWAPRIAQGYDTLVSHAINGIRTMPARGGNPALTDGEVASAVVDMANASGAKFAAPAPKAPEAKPVEPSAAASAPVAVAEEAKASLAQATGKSGEEVYKAGCAMCHTSGLMEAPKLGDENAWKPRIAQGYDTLVNHANKGIRMMPAKGGNSALSDAEVAGAVKYMANEAGAGF
ncbi:cytochrome c5 family protein [Methylotenera sp.]|uniref:c-type cytochrome n=1 Tax=Methylotenera sp. TaxID=2051956 RepID=UPI002732104A|nr:c-type cytochrome [Methylotenera sp.]MDP2070066.1 c-type cytochrome [Methylotenera sp.]MDP3006481.1 c-type cytochrome [Methylotenera sp.]